MQQLATNVTGTHLQLVSNVQLTRLSLARLGCITGAIYTHNLQLARLCYQALWHPGSERPIYLALPAQRPCLLETHNNLVQKNNRSIDASGV